MIPFPALLVGLDSPDRQPEKTPVQGTVLRGFARGHYWFLGCFRQRYRFRTQVAA